MKKLIASLMFVVLAVGVMPGFAKRDYDIKVLINKEVTAKDGLKVAFVELIEDSRCPTDANCIWAGNAKIRVRVTKSGKSKLIELNTMANGTAPEFAGHQFKLVGLTPYPRSDIRIDRNGYEATIAVTKAT